VWALQAASQRPCRRAPISSQESSWTTLPKAAIRSRLRRGSTHPPEIVEAICDPPDATTMPPGLPMKIPITSGRFGPFQILPDSAFVNGPSQIGFSPSAYVAAQPGWWGSTDLRRGDRTGAGDRDTSPRIGACRAATGDPEYRPGPFATNCVPTYVLEYEQRIYAARRLNSCSSSGRPTPEQRLLRVALRELTEFYTPDGTLSARPLAERNGGRTFFSLTKSAGLRY
jgi:hypothetical protein